jgi:hypothetical protein
MPNRCNHCDPIVKRWSKRFRATIFFITLNFVTFWLGITEDQDPINLATALSMLNGTLFAYLWAESAKPSKEIEKDEIHT